MANTLGDLKNRASRMGISARSRGRIQSDPHINGALTPSGGLTNPNQRRSGKAAVTVPSIERPSDIKREDFWIGRLDDAVHQRDSWEMNLSRFMVAARRDGVSCATIAVVVGITEGSVRRAIKRAGDVV